MIPSIGVEYPVTDFEFPETQRWRKSVFRGKYIGQGVSKRSLPVATVRAEKQGRLWPCEAAAFQFRFQETLFNP